MPTYVIMKLVGALRIYAQIAPVSSGSTAHIHVHLPRYFMNCYRETTKMGVPPGTAGCRFRGVPERYVAGADTRGRQEGRPYPWSQQVIHEISGLDKLICTCIEW